MTNKNGLRLVIDIETNGFAYTKLHSLVMLDLANGKIYSFADQPGYRSIKDGLHILSMADEVIGHNIIGFDLPAIRKLHNIVIPREKVTDTLTLARVLWPDRREADEADPDMPVALRAKHSLAAWGYRLKRYKDTFASTTDWRFWTRAMQGHCETDVEVTAELFLRIEAELALRGSDSHVDPFLQMAGTP